MEEKLQTVSMHGNSDFVFVHGAWSGAWSWDLVVPILERVGHRAVAVDLPGHGKDVSDIRKQTGDTYARKVAEVITGLARRVILVGNSMGGSIISRVAELIPEKIDKLVYISAFLLRDGESGNGLDGHGIKPEDWASRSEDGLTIAWTPVAMPDGLREDQKEQWRYRESVRRKYESIAALSGPVHLTDERFGSIRRFYVYCNQDESIYPELQRQMIRNLPCEVVYEMTAGHTPQYYNPEELCMILHDISRR